ncbi:hypothetical protein PR202_ga28381 [Eleusine coracana subsp. coracana]|uniref:PNPLA domain-containing protein n=1 Tax=Eleusine coracana subsp. coracana TaxID=191504 RepID=A0AAV5DJ29_ELECO|nr:hypothetical protein PR202_ga28381 [Eleusine coracana subsp. coracana]
MEMETPNLAEAAEEQQCKDDAASRLTYEIFSILETKFLFGSAVITNPAFSSSVSVTPAPPPPTTTTTTQGSNNNNKVCVLSIDGGARPADALLAAAALVRLEASLRRRAGNTNNKDAADAHYYLPDFFDVAAGSGAGGVLAAMLFARGPGGRPAYSAHDALAFLLRRVRRGGRWPTSRRILLRRVGRAPAAAFEKVFGELTLRDTVRPVLVLCYDLATRAPLLFSRAAAMGSLAHDFLLRDVCAATCACGEEEVAVASVDGTTRVAAAGGGALGNPAAAAITHVLNNRREFPGVAGVGDLLVLSVGTGGGDVVVAGDGRSKSKSKPAEIAAEGVSDMVDQAVAMAFGQSRTSNYVRIQGTGTRRAGGGGRGPRTACGGETEQQAAWKAEAMLLQKGVESVLFQGRRIAGETNAEKLERFRAGAGQGARTAQAAASRRESRRWRPARASCASAAVSRRSGGICRCYNGGRRSSSAGSSAAAAPAHAGDRGQPEARAGDVVAWCSENSNLVRGFRYSDKYSAAALIE